MPAFCHFELCGPEPAKGNDEVSLTHVCWKKKMIMVFDSLFPVREVKEFRVSSLSSAVEQRRFAMTIV